jgi:DNA polymerase alpha subunit B
MIPTSPLRYDSDSSQILSQDSPLKTSQNGENFLNRENSGQVLIKYNENLLQRDLFQRSTSLPLGRRCLIQIQNLIEFSNILEPYRYMFTPLEERALSIEKHLNFIQESMIESLNLSNSDIKPLSMPSPSLEWVCGRVCKDAEDGKINSTSVILQGSRLESAGKRVLLNLTEIPHYSLFPGQIILVQGINSSGRELYAKRIIEGIPRPLPMTSPEKLLEYHHSTYYQNGNGLKIFTASGPFTTSDNLSYFPLDHLIQLIVTQKPDLVILIGPFVDLTQPLLQNSDRQLSALHEDGSVQYGTEHNATNELVFIEKIIRDGLNAYFNSEENLPTNFILIPSLHDGHHPCVFPQPPLENILHAVTIDCPPSRRPSDPFLTFNEVEIPFSREKDSLKRIYLAPNPCMFK